MNMRTPMPIAYITAVKAIQAATNLALGFALRINTPLIIIPKPITKIPPTPAKKGQSKSLSRHFRSSRCSFLCLGFKFQQTWDKVPRLSHFSFSFLDSKERKGERKRLEGTKYVNGTKRRGKEGRRIGARKFARVSIGENYLRSCSHDELASEIGSRGTLAGRCRGRRSVGCAARCWPSGT